MNKYNLFTNRKSSLIIRKKKFKQNNIFGFCLSNKTRRTYIGLFCNPFNPNTFAFNKYTTFNQLDNKNKKKETIKIKRFKNKFNNSDFTETKNVIPSLLFHRFFTFQNQKSNVNKSYNSQQIPYFNHCFDKNRVKALITWYVKVFGENTAIELVEKLKELGFYYATHAGISIGVDDLKIPANKFSLIAQAETSIYSLKIQFSKGNLTSIERFQKLIETWHRTSESIKKNVIHYFESTNILNPIYMMAFSGARGNISQVRQLVGMRGLMADPQGQILDFPIQSNFREGLTLTEYIISCYGARKGVVDTALRTAKSGYLTRRLVDVAQHIVVSKLDCGTELGFVVKDLKSKNKVLLNLERRLVGRVLAETIYLPPLNIKNIKTKTKSSLFRGSDKLAKAIPSFEKFSSESSSFPPFLNKNETGLSTNTRFEFESKNNQLSSFLDFGKNSAYGMLSSISKKNQKKESFIVASRNQEISSQLATQIIKYKKQVLIRSPLSCKAKQSVCQLCYGWSLSQKNLVALGEAVGVIAAQSIGEPGTQLTMRTFHTGGVFSADVLDQIYSPCSGKIRFPSSIEGTLIRTPNGKIAFFTQYKGHLEVVSGIQYFEENTNFNNAKKKDWKNLKKNNLKDIRIITIKIPPYTALFVKQGEIVYKNQLIGETSFKDETETDQSIETHRVVNSDMNGEIYFENIPVKQKTMTKISLNKPIRQFTFKTISGLGSLWLLSGKQIFFKKTSIQTTGITEGEIPLILKSSFSYVGDIVYSKSLIYQSFFFDVNALKNETDYNPIPIALDDLNHHNLFNITSQTKLSVRSLDLAKEYKEIKKHCFKGSSERRTLSWFKKQKPNIKDPLLNIFKIQYKNPNYFISHNFPLSNIKFIFPIKSKSKSETILNFDVSFLTKFRFTWPGFLVCYTSRIGLRSLGFSHIKDTNQIIQKVNHLLKDQQMINHPITYYLNKKVIKLKKFKIKPYYQISSEIPNRPYNKIKYDLFALDYNQKSNDPFLSLDEGQRMSNQRFERRYSTENNYNNEKISKSGMRSNIEYDRLTNEKKIKTKILNWFPNLYKTKGGIYFFKKVSYSTLRTNTKLTRLIWNFILFNQQKQLNTNEISLVSVAPKKQSKDPSCSKKSTRQSKEKSFDWEDLLTNNILSIRDITFQLKSLLPTPSPYSKLYSKKNWRIDTKLLDLPFMGNQSWPIFEEKNSLHNRNKTTNFILEQKQVSQVFGIKQNFYKTAILCHLLNPIKKTNHQFIKTQFNFKNLNRGIISPIAIPKKVRYQICQQKKN